MKRKINIVVGMVFATAMLLTITAGCSGKKSIVTKVTIAYNPSGYGSVVSHIMIAENTLDKYLPDGVTAEWVEMSSASNIRDALANGTVDIAAPALSAFISAKENKMSITLISNYGNAIVHLYSCCGYSDITDFKDSDLIVIKGLNTNPQISFLAYVKESGLDINKYSKLLSKVPEAESLSMMKNNREIAGAILSYPVSNEAEKIDNVKLIADFEDVINEYNLGNCLCANSGFYNGNYEIVAAFENARDEIMDSWENNLDHNADILSELYGCNKNEIITIMRELPPTKEITGYDKLSELMYESGMLREQTVAFESLENYDKIPH